MYVPRPRYDDYGSPAGGPGSIGGSRVVAFATAAVTAGVDSVSSQLSTTIQTVHLLLLELIVYTIISYSSQGTQFIRRQQCYYLQLRQYNEPTLCA